MFVATCKLLTSYLKFSSYLKKKQLPDSVDSVHLFSAVHSTLLNRALDMNLKEMYIQFVFTRYSIKPVPTNVYELEEMGGGERRIGALTCVYDLIKRTHINVSVRCIIIKWVIYNVSFVFDLLTARHTIHFPLRLRWLIEWLFSCDEKSIKMCESCTKNAQLSSTHLQ